MAIDATYEVFDGFFELRFRDEAIDHAQVESAFGGDGFTGEDKLESDFGPDKKRQNRGGKRRKNTDADFGLGEACFGSGNHKVTESGQLRAATDGRTIYDADNGLAQFEHSGEGSVEGVQHLKDALRSVFADVDAAAKNFAGRIENDQFDVLALAGVSDAVRHFAKHGFVEKIVLRAGEGHARDTTVAPQLHEFEFVRRALRRCCEFFVDGLDHFHTPVDHCFW